MTTDDHDPPRLRLPDPDLPALAQLEAMLAERDRLTGWIDRQCRPDGDIAGLAALIASATGQRRALISRRLDIAALLAPQEIARRAERALHMTIDLARDAGLLIRRGQNGRASRAQVRELSGYGLNSSTINAFVHAWRLPGEAEPVSDEDFETAIKRCQVLGDLSRPALAAMLRDLPDERLPQDRVARLRRLAGEGGNSEQIAAELGIGAIHVRREARRHGIEIPGDKVAHRVRRAVDPIRTVDAVVEMLTEIHTSLAMLTPEDYAAIPRERKAAWSTALRPALRTITNLPKELTK